jgi:hypothetical protein
MRTHWWFRFIVILLLLEGVSLGITQREAQAVDNYCGEEPQDAGGLGLDLNEACKASFGLSASAATMKPDPYGWVCKVSGQPDKGLDVQAACRRTYGNSAIATLVGIGIYDWRCLRPADVSGHVIPVLLFPVEKVKASEAPWVTSALKRLEALMGGARRFYRERTSAAVRGTSAFVLPTGTTAKDWQNLAIATDHASGGFPLDRFGLHHRVKQELTNGGWSLLVGASSVKVAGFVTLGAGYPEPPTSYGAASDPGGPYFSLPPSASVAPCSPSTTGNYPEYENAFFTVGNRFGAALGLPRTDQYPFNDLLLRPVDWQQSIMYSGNGTKSFLFPFEFARLLPILTNWR